MHYCDVVLLLWQGGEVPDEAEWTARTRALGRAGRAVLVVEMAAQFSDEGVPGARFDSALKAAAAQDEAEGKGSPVEVVTSSELSHLYPGTPPWRGERPSKLSPAGKPDAESMHLVREAAAVCTLAVRRAVARHLCSVYKVFVADCDGTLWQGVASEDGADGVSFGEAQMLLQRALLRLQRHGRLVCIASKNEEQDVLDVFERRGAEMPLALELITERQIHWHPKTLSLERISASLDLPLGAIVFIDDNPAELLAVNAALPEVCLYAWCRRSTQHTRLLLTLVCPSLLHRCCAFAWQTRRKRP